MQTTNHEPDKRTDDSTDSDRDVSLIDENACRFAAVTRSLETKSVPELGVELPCTRAAYVDESGEYGIEREFFGHRDDWDEIARTVVVTDTEAVREIPARHTARYKSILAVYQRVLAEE